MKNKLKKISIGLFTSIFIPSCSVTQENVSNESNYKIPIVKADFKISDSNTNNLEQLLNFESKVPLKKLEQTDDLPESRFFKILFRTEVKGKLGIKSIKVPKNGIFKINIMKGNKFKITDNDATDGVASIEVPENAVESYIKILNPHRNDNNTKITLSDELYYVKQEMKYESVKIKNKKREEEKDDYDKDERYENDRDYCEDREGKERIWYKIGKKPLNIPEDWKSPDGTKYVLNFKNQGVKDMSMRFYKSNTYEYPDGIGKVGVKGGSVSLTGVGKIEIPQGALNIDTTIVLRQELSGYRPEIIGTHYSFFLDFLSPIMKVEPFGLKLNKPADFYTETDKARLGNNNPWLILEGRTSINKKNWRYENINPAIVPKLKDWKDDYPFKIDTFSYFAKFMRATIKPDSGATQFIPDESFNIQSNNTNNIVLKFLSRDTLEKDEKLSITNRLNSAYVYYNQLTELDPKSKWNDKKNGIINVIPIYMNNLGVGFGGQTSYEEGKSSIEINLDDDKGRFGEEHEMWHVFQYANNTEEEMNKYIWIRESSAMYMGAKTFNEYGKKLTDSKKDKDQYIVRLDKSIVLLNEKKPISSIKKRLDLPIKYGSGKGNELKNSNNYNRTNFFTFLSHPNTKSELTEDKKSELYPNLGTDKYQIDVIINRAKIIKHYQDYAVHSYIRDRFFDSDYEPKEYISPENLDELNSKIQKSKKDFDLYNNSSRYFKIKVKSDEYTKNPTLGIKIVAPKEGNCGKNTKASVVFLDEIENPDTGSNTKIPIKLPQYLDLEDAKINLNTEKISESRIKKNEVDKDGIVKLKSDRLYPFIGVNKDFTTAIVVVSNSDETIYESETEDESTCSYTIESCLYCFD